MTPHRPAKNNVIARRALLRIRTALHQSSLAATIGFAVSSALLAQTENRYQGYGDPYGSGTSVPATQPTGNRYQPAQTYSVAQQGYGQSVPLSAAPNYNTLPQPGLSQPYVQPQQSANAPVFNGVSPNSNFIVGPEPVLGVPQFPQQPLPPQGAFQPAQAPTSLEQPLPPLNVPWTIDPDFNNGNGTGYQPRVRDVPIDVYVQEAQTGRFVLGGSVNTDLGVAGNVIIEERNFDVFNWPSRPGELFNGAFRGGGQNFRLEAVPGNRVQRYSVDLTEPNLFGYSPFSLSTGLFFFNRIYRDYDEERLGGRLALGYIVTPDMQVSTEIRAENVEIYNPRINGVPILDRAIGNNDVYTGRVRLTHNTRDSPFLPTQGHHLELIYDQVFGEFDFPRAQVNFSRYFLVRERADGGGRHTFTTSYRLGFSGADTPIFENFFAGGFSTMRGFRFRGASPVENDVQVGGRFQFLGSLEYMMPLTADDMLRMVAFVDYGTVEQNIEVNFDNFRVAPGLGLRVAVPALGPAPLAFDFAFPINRADTDQTQTFSFNAGFTR